MGCERRGPVSLPHSEGPRLPLAGDCHAVSACAACAAAASDAAASDAAAAVAVSDAVVSVALAPS